jgi:hypothetical protein
MSETNDLRFITTTPGSCGTLIGTDSSQVLEDRPTFSDRQYNRHRSGPHYLRQPHFKLPHKTDREHQLWQEGSHPQMIADERMMWQKLEYIHNNPVRRGYVDDPIHWRYSSAKNYSKLPALVPVIVDWM